MAFERRTGAAWAIHPGEILRREFLKPMNITGYRLAKAMDVHPPTVNDILLKKRALVPFDSARCSRCRRILDEFASCFELAHAKKTMGNED